MHGKVLRVPFAVLNNSDHDILAKDDYHLLISLICILSTSKSMSEYYLLKKKGLSEPLDKRNSCTRHEKTTDV